MKFAKIYSVLAAAAALFGAASCSNPDTPVMQKPTEFKLNVPPFAEQYYGLNPDGQLELTCSQPDYGVGTATNYSAEMSLTEDFAVSIPLSNINGASATILLSEQLIAEGMCELLGITDEDTWQAYANDHVRPLYFRAIANVSGVEWSKITSNVVKLSNVSFYYALKTPGYIFLTGIPSFVEPSEGNRDKLVRLYEDESAIGSKIYSAVLDVPAGTVSFRFYTELTGWGKANCLGAAEADMNNVNITSDFNEGVYNGPVVVEGQSNWEFAWDGGKITMTVNLNDNTIKIEAGAQSTTPTQYVYMVGSQALWKEPSEANQAVYDNWRLECSDGSGVYTGKFEIVENDKDNPDLFCRFYKALAGWGAAQWASTTGENFAVTPGVAADTAVGEGCFQLAGALGKTINVTLDTNNNKVTFSFVE